MLAPVARFLALLACAAVLLIAQPASAIDAKCSACSAVASELGEALEAERPRNHLDMRGRLDSKGQRYGKLIDYKVSELRFVELLEGLCASVASKYRLDASVAASDEQPGAEWTKGRRPKGAAGKAMRAEIEGYCHRLVEEQEEALQAALYAGELDPATAEEKMCRDFALRDCEGEPRETAAREGEGERVEGSSERGEEAQEEGREEARGEGRDGREGEGEGALRRRSSRPPLSRDDEETIQIDLMKDYFPEPAVIADPTLHSNPGRSTPPFSSSCRCRCRCCRSCRSSSSSSSPSSSSSSPSSSSPFAPLS